jgi:RNA polymerase sigma-70 factor (ECF subfamily)
MSNTQDAEDVVQETYLRGYRSFHTFLPETNFKAWMTKILLNVINDSLRKRSRYNEVIDREYGHEMLDTVADQSGAALNPELKFTASEIRPDLMSALQCLPSTLLHPLLLRELEDFSYDQIAALLDIPVGTVMSRLFRARRTVRDKLSDTYIGNKKSVGRV